MEFGKHFRLFSVQLRCLKVKFCKHELQHSKKMFNVEKCIKGKNGDQDLFNDRYAGSIASKEE